MALSPERLGGRLTLDPRYSLDNFGNLTPDDPAGRQALAEKGSGRFTLVRTAPDLLCLVRSPTQGGQLQPPRAVLVGDVSAFPLADLIALLAQSRWSGVLRTQTPSGERSVFFKDGEVRGGTSDDPLDRIGEVMVRLGYVTREKLQEALLETPPSKVGRSLVERGDLQAHDLWKCLTEQVSEIFHAVLLSREGAFFLLDQEFDAKTVHSLNLSTQSLLMDSIRKIDEMAHFRQRIPHARVVLQRLKTDANKLEPEEQRVLSLLDRNMSVLDLGKLARLSEFEITKAVFRLLELKCVKVVDTGAPAPAAEPPAQPSQPPVAPRLKPPERTVPTVAAGKDARAVARTFNFIFREIRDEVGKRGMEKEFIAAANAALVGQALSTSPVIAPNLSFDLDGNLSEQRLIEQYERVKAQLGPEPLAALRQALSDVMFFLLFQAGELLGTREDENLAKRVKELLATLDGQ